MNRIGLVLLISSCFLCAWIFAAEVDVNGKWDMTISTPRGERSTTAEFVQEGEDLTVVVQGRQGEVEAKGSVKGSDIEWTIRRETSRGTFELVYKGKVDGDTMEGTVQFGSRGSGEWSAKRAE